MGALCSYGRADKLESIERARSISQFPDSITKNQIYLKRQESRMQSGVQLTQRYLNAGIEKLALDDLMSRVDEPVPDDITFRNLRGFFPRLLEDHTHPRPDISRLGLLPGITWLSYQHYFNELLQQQHILQHTSQYLYHEQIKTIYFVRHGEATHNVAEEELGGERWESVEARSETYFDPPLTEHGIQQSQLLGSYISHAITKQNFMVDCIIVSPLIRAIETAQVAFAHLWNKIPIICLENARETIGIHTCDRRRSRTELKQRYPNIIFDLLSDGDDPLWHSDSRETDLARLQRAARLVNFVFTLPYKYIAIVSHGGIMRAATTVLMAETHDHIEWRATTLQPNDIYGYQIDKGSMLPVCAHRKILPQPTSARGVSRTHSRQPSVSLSNVSLDSQ